MLLGKRPEQKRRTLFTIDNRFNVFSTITLTYLHTRKYFYMNNYYVCHGGIFRDFSDSVVNCVCAIRRRRSHVINSQSKNQLHSVVHDVIIGTSLWKFALYVHFKRFHDISNRWRVAENTAGPLRFPRVMLGKTTSVIHSAQRYKRIRYVTYLFFHARIPGYNMCIHGFPRYRPAAAAVASSSSSSSWKPHFSYFRTVDSVSCF